MTKRPHTIDLSTPEGIVEHMATLPTENLRRIAAREIYASPTGGNIALVFAAEAELILRDAGLGERHSLEALRVHRENVRKAQRRWDAFYANPANDYC